MEKETLTWNQIKSWWPILTGCIIIALSYATLITRIEILDTKLVNLTEKIEMYQEREVRIVAHLNDLDRRMAILETEHALNRIK